MRNLLLFLHLAAAIFWMGGMTFMVLALRPAAQKHLQPPVRLPFMVDVLRIFFGVVAVSIVVLLVTGGWLYAQVPSPRPAGWHAMAGLGLLMMLIFGHIFFSPFGRLKKASAASDWAEGGRRMGQITLLAKVNLALGWAAIAAVLLWR